MAIAVAQMRILAGRPAENVEQMLDLIRQAREMGAEIVLFPELAVSGLLLGDLTANPAFISECCQARERLAAAAGDIMVIYGNLEQRNGQLHNSVFLAYNQETTLLAAPLGAAFIRGAYQGLAPENEFRTYPLPLDGKILRVGFRLGDWRGEAVPYAAEDLDLLIDLSSWPLRLDENPVQPCPAGCAHLTVNSYGLHSNGKTNYLFPGGSSYYDASGRLIASGGLLTAGLYLWTRRGGAVIPAPGGDQLLAEALVAGVREFCALNHCHQAVIGSSGGIDSALAACVYSQALGADKVLLLSMPSRFNSETTKSLAAQMAAGLGTGFATLPIDNSVEQLLAQFAASGWRNAAGERRQFSFTGGALENVQARERCRLLAAAAAAVNGVFTCNGNKAELSVGYATFYGDLAGAFAAQADLWKFQVYAAAAWFRSIYPQAPLAQIASLRPSAELSPAQAVEKGGGDPLIYPYHDYLLRSWVELGHDPAQTLALYAAGRLEETIGCAPGLTQELFPQPLDFVRDVEYWWRQYRGLSVAKRIQAPPLLALSSVPFGEEKPQVAAAPYFSAAYCRHKSELLGP